MDTKMQEWVRRVGRQYLDAMRIDQLQVVAMRLGIGPRNYSRKVMTDKIIERSQVTYWR